MASSQKNSVSFNLLSRLARWDKPVGIWLLFLPCMWGLGLGLHVSQSPLQQYWHYGCFLLIGSFLMRSAGCIYNDWCDREIDAQVERTASRPLASGEISPRAAWIFIAVLASLSLGVLWFLPPLSALIAASAIVPVLLYPWMKRITYWPQLFLGITFNWGIWVGFFAIGAPFHPGVGILFMAAILWTLAYDTIYGLQDLQDDLRVGVKSSSVAMRAFLQPFLMLCYVWMAALLIYLGVMMGFGAVYFAHMVVVCSLAVWQIATLDPADAQNALLRFKSNVWLGAVMASGLLCEYVF